MTADYQEITNALREKNGVSSTVVVNGHSYAVTTTTKKSKYGWYYETTVIPNDRKTTTPEDGRWQAPADDSEEKWSAFLQEAAKRHLDKCARITGDIATGTAGRKSLLIIVALIGVALVAAAAYFYFNSPGSVDEPAQPAGSIPMETPAVSPPPATTLSEPSSLPPQPQGSSFPPVALPASPPTLDPDKIEAIITAPSARQPPLSAPPTDAQLQDKPPKNNTRENKGKENRIECILSPQDCQ